MGGVRFHDISFLNISLGCFQSTHMHFPSFSVHFLFLVTFLVASLYIFKIPITILKIIEVFVCIVLLWFDCWLIAILVRRIWPTASRKFSPISLYTWEIITAYQWNYCLIWESNQYIYIHVIFNELWIIYNELIFVINKMLEIHISLIE